ncbi:ABC transporter ATP-binding protein [Candidatus Cetobacterium colombiensis]|uniref:ABC transporter ATP-binding protein n=1 Tax=Candidatus Cetobacterium colombiensis TaxID=3073100 RepID=A0ABU4WC54_9FUSO|nr:ABC transporter ATP-binding protein [Candidatus Cetobacterium colombiensis]MDX8336607.1 ABC transporter ATP-binding protein [Candidatus Cetobacterium colombiensis]
MSNKVLELSKIDKEYGEKVITKVLQDINLTFYQGEFIAIIGQSGSGKSTLLNIIGSLDKPTRGEIIFRDKNISSFSSDEMAKFRNASIGFIFQFHYLLPEFTVLENVLMPTWIRTGYDTEEEKERALELLEYVGLKDYVNRSSNNLSGGQQQRVAIARALMNRSDIILADEPTGNLDSESSKQIYKLLREINLKFKTTFIIVTHDPRISDMCDRVIEIMDGKIIKDEYKKMVE